MAQYPYWLTLLSVEYQYLLVTSILLVAAISAALIITGDKK
jgi:hypothetical protein